MYLGLTSLGRDHEKIGAQKTDAPTPVSKALQRTYRFSGFQMRTPGAFYCEYGIFLIVFG